MATVARAGAAVGVAAIAAAGNRASRAVAATTALRTVLRFMCVFSKVRGPRVVTLCQQSCPERDAHIRPSRTWDE
ncbi:hypothetical protein GCM10010326_75550 [Streptomyces xanthochromogenes]|uniref:Secreted protein n=1 Tax=Streptomyces xanthochromogenes TaxID=67384 RepID=A0ABQ3AYW8_9ACTN|nr:hypothetical protein GCM10010326_75550 [Streptomyces xanthochromogenes]